MGVINQRITGGQHPVYNLPWDHGSHEFAGTRTNLMIFWKTRCFLESTMFLILLDFWVSCHLAKSQVRPNRAHMHAYIKTTCFTFFTYILYACLYNCI